MESSSTSDGIPLPHWIASNNFASKNVASNQHGQFPANMRPVMIVPCSVCFCFELLKKAFTNPPMLQHPNCLLSKWMLWIQEWWQCCPSAPQSTRDSTLAPSSLVDEHKSSPTMTWRTENRWLWFSCYRSGDTACKAPRSYSLCTPITRI